MSFRERCPAVVVTALLAACAPQPGVGAAATAVPVPVQESMTPVLPGGASCAQGAAPVSSMDPSASFDVNDPRQRALRVLAEQHRPTPRRGVVPEAAVPGAEACVYALKLSFALLAAGSRGVPDEATIAGALRSAGLTEIVVRSGPVFAASTGAACVYGSFTAPGPAFQIGPRAGSCR